MFHVEHIAKYGGSRCRGDQKLFVRCVLKDLQNVLRKRSF